MVKYRLCEGVVTADAEQVNILTAIFGLACFNTRDSCVVFLLCMESFYFCLTSVWRHTGFFIKKVEDVLCSLIFCIFQVTFFWESR